MLSRSRWAAIGAAVAVSLGAGGIGMVTASLDSGDRPVIVTVTPERVLDTRVDLGLAGPFVSQTPRELAVTGAVPVASGGSTTVVPVGATAVLVNVTVVAPTDLGHLSVRPGGSTGEPSTSTVNFVAGSVEPNAATVDLGPGGTVQIYLRTASPTGSADVLLDIVGYTIDHTHPVDDTQPQPVTAAAHVGGEGPYEPIRETPVEVVAATLTAPADGIVTVIADAHLFTMSGGTFSMQCGLTTGSTVESGHEWYVAVPGSGPASGVRTFEVTGGDTNTYRLVCTTWGVSGDDIAPMARNAHLSATYTQTAD